MGHDSHWSSHTFQGDEQGSLTVPIAAARVYTRKQGRRKAGWCLYVCLTVRGTAQRIHRRYGHRFGIESSTQLIQAAQRTWLLPAQVG